MPNRNVHEIMGHLVGLMRWLWQQNGKSSGKPTSRQLKGFWINLSCLIAGIYTIRPHLRGSVLYTLE